MNILFTHQKGGVGKTTLCVLLANYLVLEKKEEVIVIDMDDQRTLFDHWHRDRVAHDLNLYLMAIEALEENPQLRKIAIGVHAEADPLHSLIQLLSKSALSDPSIKMLLDSLVAASWEQKQLYSVLSTDLDSYLNIKPVLDKAKGSFVLIDLPGKLDDDALVPIFQDADLIICPTRYDGYHTYSTLHFAAILKSLNPKAPIVFIPNKVKPSVKYELKEEIRTRLEMFGRVTADIPDWVAFERNTTHSIDKDIRSMLNGVYGSMYDQLLEKKAL